MVPKSDIYSLRFQISQDIGDDLERVGKNSNEILNLIVEKSPQFDNMNAYDALGYLHREMLLGTDQLPESLLKDERFLELCKILYKKSRSYPPNACVGIVARLVELGVPFQSPLVYLFLNLLKNSVNKLTLVDTVTFATLLAPYENLRLPTALKEGLLMLLEYHLDADLKRCLMDLDSHNPYFNERNLILLLKHFAPGMDPKLRKDFLATAVEELLGSESLSGSNLIKFLKLVDSSWIQPTSAHLCLRYLENFTVSSMDECLEIAAQCLR